MIPAKAAWNEMTEFIHRPVLLDQCIEGLNIAPQGVYVDGTLGGAGHATAIAGHPNFKSDPGLLIGIDRDGTAIKAGEERLACLGVPFKLIRDEHENIRQVLNDLSISAVDGFLLDLGMSSHQLDKPDRGFSYRYDAPLDMRMDDRSKLTAFDIVNECSESELAEIIKKYGEERYAKRIARAIVDRRVVKTTMELADIIANATPKHPSKYSSRRSSDHPSKHSSKNLVGNPATRTFQAIRIAVNGELVGLAQTINDMLEFLKPGGRICIISFHSLEDRIVKRTFKYWSAPCQCPREIPYCVCGKKPSLKIITKKPIIPSSCETEENPRAHSAKLRIAEKIMEIK